MRKNSKSLRKSSLKKKVQPKKLECIECLKLKINPLSVQLSLNNKHSASQKNYHNIKLIDNLLNEKHKSILAL